MAFFVFDIENNWVTRQFYCAASDMIGAHMKAMEFAELLEKRTKERYGEDWPVRVSLVAEWQHHGINEDGIEMFLDSLKDYLSVE